VEAARRYLFETELRELLEEAQIPEEAMNSSGDSFPLSVAQVAVFNQGLSYISGEDKAIAYGREAFQKCTAIIARGTNIPPVLRAVSSADKLFLRIRESMANFNRQMDTNVIVKWHGGAESEVFSDSAWSCYGYVSSQPICLVTTGFLEEAISHLSGVKVVMEERECMAKGALTCRWHCALA
jgi:hypothetical protein